MERLMSPMLAGRIGAVAVVVSSCTGLVLERVHSAAAPVIACSASNQTVLRHDIPDSVAVGWTVTGCGREAECSYIREHQMDCYETPASKERLAERKAKKDAEANEMAVIDR